MSQDEPTYYQIEFHQLAHLKLYVLRPGAGDRRLVDEYDYEKGQQAEEGAIATIAHQYPGAVRLFSSLMEAELKRRWSGEYTIWQRP